MTSFVFMLLDVPEPVWKTSIGKCASCATGGDLVGGGDDRVGDVLVEDAELGVRLGAGRP